MAYSAEQSAILRRRTWEYMSLCVEVEYNERMDAHDKSYFLRTLHGYLNPENRWPDESLTEWFARTEQEWADYVNPKIHPKLRRG